MTVSSKDLEKHLDLVTSRVAHPDHGIYGPESIMWTVARESVLFFGGGRAALLQTAHPFVAHAIDQHSKTRTDLPGRFHRTFSHVFDMTFGSLEEALTSARRVHAVHAQINGKIEERIGSHERGSQYRANNEEALLWVYATLIDTAVMMYEAIVKKLSIEEKNALYDESRLFAYLFGIPDSVMPRDWTDFQIYFQTMLESDVIQVGGPAIEIRQYLLSPPRRLSQKMWRWYSTMTAGFLHPRIRDEYGFVYGRKERLAFELSLRSVRQLYRSTPRRFRCVPAFSHAQRRISGSKMPDLITPFTERLITKALGG